MSKVSRWTITINSPIDPPPLWDPSKMAYLVYGLEKAPTTGHQHWQTYCRFSNRCKLQAVKNTFKNQSIHAEPSKGNEQSNRDYCLKDGCRTAEFGLYDGGQGVQGRRSDLEDVAKQIKEGKTLKEIAEVNPVQYIKFSRGIRELQLQLQPAPPKERPIKVIVYWGPTGTGKTHRVMNKHEEVYIVSPGRSPWDSYNGQDVIFFDEFSDSDWDVNQMLKYLDKWRVELSARYNNKFANWSKVYIASNEDPHDFYKFLPQSKRDAFFRRLSEIHHITTYPTLLDRMTSQDLSSTQ